MSDRPPLARTSAEAHLWLQLNPCACGATEFVTRRSVVAVGELLCSEYTGPCQGCGTVRRVRFALSDEPRPASRNGVDYGGDEPSELLDPGQWLFVADRYATKTPASRDDVDVAQAAVGEVLKFLPEGVEELEASAFWTPLGLCTYHAEPGRFRRARLVAVREAYRALHESERPHRK